jgi:hypothetical protein
MAGRNISCGTGAALPLHVVPLSWKAMQRSLTSIELIISSVLYLICCAPLYGGIKDSAVQEAIADPSCDFIKKLDHSDPNKLIEEFLKRAANGQFLKADTWLDGADLCPGHEPGPDLATVVTGYRILKRSITDRRAEFNVAFESVGELGPSDKGSKFDLRKHQVRIKYIAWKTSYGWRLYRPKSGGPGCLDRIWGFISGELRVDG